MLIHIASFVQLSCSARWRVLAWRWPQSMYEAGCAGDLKTGSYGDMAEALRLETRAAGAAGVGAILAALVAGTLPRLGPIRRFFGASSVIVVSNVFFLFGGVYFETSGVQACFP